MIRPRSRGRLSRGSGDVEPIRPFPRVDEVPFDSDRRANLDAARTPEGLILYTKGALETVLPLCTEVDTDSGAEPLTPEWRTGCWRPRATMADDGLRVLAVAYRPVDEGYDRDRARRATCPHGPGRSG